MSELTQEQIDKKEKRKQQLRDNSKRYYHCNLTVQLEKQKLMYYKKRYNADIDKYKELYNQNDVDIISKIKIDIINKSVITSS
jgi:hypothetical protein